MPDRRSHARTLVFALCAACGDPGSADTGTASSTGTGDTDPTASSTVGTSSATSTGEPTGGPAVYDELWPGPGSAFAVVADAGGVFWTVVVDGQTRVLGYDKTSGAVNEVAAVPGAEGNPTAGIAVDADNVYWVTRMGDDEDDLWQAPRTGGAALSIATSASSGYSVAADGTSVYWRADGLVKVPVGGGAATVLVDDCAAFTIAEGLAFCSRADGLLVSVPLTGGEPTTIFDGMGSLAASNLVVDPTTVYMRNAGAIHSVPRAGGAAEKLWSGSLAFTYAQFGFAGDDANLYFLDFSVTSGSTPVRLAKQGGAPTPLGEPSLELVGLAVDATHVYLTTSEGALLRAPK